MTNKNILLEYREPMLHGDMMEYLDIFSTRYRFLRIIYIGRSPYGKSIPVIKIGTGEKNIIYTAGVNGSEMLTSIMMMRFINEFCELMKTEQRVYNVGIDYIFNTRSLYIIPMVNPDSIEKCKFEGNDQSKPDIKPVVGFVDSLSNVKLMTTYRTCGDYITCPDINAFRMQSLIKLYARMTGCNISDLPCVYNCNCNSNILNLKKFPIFDISCDNNEFYKSYMRLREFLFTAPILC